MQDIEQVEAAYAANQQVCNGKVEKTPENINSGGG
jgi:hypothetical protein